MVSEGVGRLGVISDGGWWCHWSSPTMAHFHSHPSHSKRSWKPNFKPFQELKEKNRQSQEALNQFQGILKSKQQTILKDAASSQSFKLTQLIFAIFSLTFERIYHSSHYDIAGKERRAVVCKFLPAERRTAQGATFAILLLHQPELLSTPSSLLFRAEKCPLEFIVETFHHLLCFLLHSTPRQNRAVVPDIVELTVQQTDANHLQMVSKRTTLASSPKRPLDFATQKARSFDTLAGWARRQQVWS